MYFKFDTKTRGQNVYLRKKRETVFGKLLNRLDKILCANPDFEDRIWDVGQWYVEYDESCDSTWREIGLDVHGNVIIKMPDERNYGYWLDTNCTIDFFRSQSGFQIISEQAFEELWNSVYYDRKEKDFKHTEHINQEKPTHNRL